jgi:hypothetical protein
MSCRVLGAFPNLVITKFYKTTRENVSEISNLKFTRKINRALSFNPEKLSLEKIVSIGYCKIY